MSGQNRQDLKEITDKIELLEKRLQKLIFNINENISIAKLLQKKLIPNQLQEIPGMKAIGRFIPGEDISAEGYDLFTDKAKKHLWFTCYWTETFGLSSVLLQSLIHLQLRNQEKNAQDSLDLDSAFHECIQQIKNYKEGLKFRLLMTKVDLFTLKAQFQSIGMPSLVTRNFLERDSNWEILHENKFEKLSEVLEFGVSDRQNVSLSYEEQLKPGHRLFFVSPSWNPKAQNAQEFYSPLGLEQSLRNLELVEDLNHILVKIDQAQYEKKSDISALALEIDPKKIHIA